MTPEKTESEPDPHYSYMIGLWRHVGKIRPDGQIKWSDDQHRVALFTGVTEKQIPHILEGQAEAGVQRVGGFNDLLLSIEVIVQHGFEQLTDYHVRQKPTTVLELKEMLGETD